VSSQFLPQLFNDDTFPRLGRGRDLLATEYQSRVRLEQAARAACLSEFHFHRPFRVAFGETPPEFPTRLRLERARQMLASERAAAEVCFEIGYGSLGSFSSKFRAQFGRTPRRLSAWVRRILGYSAPTAS
jgi:AraC-like DNA-binding protein